MDIKSTTLRRVHRLMSSGLDMVEYLGLLVIGVATTIAMGAEVLSMVDARHVSLTDLLTMFLFLEVLAMIGHYFSSGHLPVRFPLYIAMVALARYLILDMKEMTEWRMLAATLAIFLLTLSVLVVRFGHVRFPYKDDVASERPYVKE